MSKQRRRLLLRINALIMAFIGVLGIMSNSSCKYGSPLFPDEPDPSDSLNIVICKYGVPSGMVAPLEQED